MRVKRLLAPASVGLANRARVLETLHSQGPSSRAQLARCLGVSRATIATIVQPLIDNGLLVERPPGRPSPAGGKPGRPIWFSADGHRLGALRISPEEVTAACMSIDGHILAQATAPTPVAGTAPDVERAILDVGRRCFHGGTLLGIGVAASGMVDTDRGAILSVHLAPVLNGFPVVQTLTRAFDAPAYVDHHPRVQALGDKWFGSGRGRNSFASVYTGEALGFGIVHNGEIIRGEHGAGGESGHTVVDMAGAECLCGRRGCWETVATLRWLRRRADELGLDNPDTTDCRTLALDVARGVDRARALMDEYARNLAVGMANNDQVLASGTYIIHGDAVGGDEPMRTRLADWMGQFCPRREPHPEVIFAPTPDNITLLGGGGLVLSSMLDTKI